MKAMLLATVATLALTASAYAASPMSGAGAHGTAQRVVHAHAPGLVTLYDQNIGDASYGWFSQTLSSYPQYDEYLADDFVVPAGHTWKVKEVDTTGFYYLGSGGPAASVNLVFWRDQKDCRTKIQKWPNATTSHLRRASIQRLLSDQTAQILRGRSSKAVERTRGTG